MRKEECGTKRMELNRDTINKLRWLIVFTVVVVVTGVNYRKLLELLGSLVHIASPFILGAAIAFVLNVPMRNIERHLPWKGKLEKLKRPAAMSLAILAVAGVLFLVTFVVAPEMINTFSGLQKSVPIFFAGVKNQAEELFASNPQILEYLGSVQVDWDQILQNMAKFLKTGAGSMLSTTMSAAVSIVNGVSTFAIGFIFAIYILFQKEVLGRQLCSLMNAFLPEPAVERTLYIAALAERLSLDYEWNFGLSFGWKPFDEQTNPFNTVVGSKINAYINLGLMLNWRFAPRWSLTAGVGLTHFSNGNTRYPNGGVNLIGGRVGVMRTFGRDAADDRRAAVRRSDPFRPYVSYDVILYGALRKKGFLQESRAYLIPGSFAVAGLNFTPMYNFSRFFRAGLSLDAQYDESANLKDHIANDYPLADELKFHRPPFKEQFAVGVSIRCEVVMPIFSINLGIGKNLIGRGDDTNSFYQVFALKADVARNVFLHVGYQLYKFRNPNNLMLGVGYRFNGR